jgi:hypothetical protein
MAKIGAISLLSCEKFALVWPVGKYAKVARKAETMARKTEQLEAPAAYAAAMDAAAAAVGLSRDRDLVVMAKLVALGAGAAKNPSISDVAAQCMWPYDATRRRLLSLRTRGFVRIKTEDRRLQLSLSAKGWWAIGTALVAMQAATEKFVGRMSGK